MQRGLHRPQPQCTGPAGPPGHVSPAHSPNRPPGRPHKARFGRWALVGTHRAALLVVPVGQCPAPRDVFSDRQGRGGCLLITCTPRVRDVPICALWWPAGHSRAQLLANRAPRFVGRPCHVWPRSADVRVTYDPATPRRWAFATPCTPRGSCKATGAVGVAPIATQMPQNVQTTGFIFSSCTRLELNCL